MRQRHREGWFSLSDITKAAAGGDIRLQNEWYKNRLLFNFWRAPCALPARICSSQSLQFPSLLWRISPPCPHLSLKVSQSIFSRLSVVCLSPSAPPKAFFFFCGIQSLYKVQVKTIRLPGLHSSKLLSPSVSGSRCTNIYPHNTFLHSSNNSQHTAITTG